MFKKWYLSRMQTEIDQRGAQIAEAKTRAAAASGTLRTEHQQLIATAEGKGRDLGLRIEKLRAAGKEHYAEVKASVEIARDEFAEAVRTARRFA
jgi:hypothetical protein